MCPVTLGHIGASVQINCWAQGMSAPSQTAKVYFLSQEKAALAHNFSLQYFETFHLLTPLPQRRILLCTHSVPAALGALAQQTPSAELQPALGWECRNTGTTVLLSYFLKIQITTLWFTQSSGRSAVVVLGL